MSTRVGQIGDDECGDFLGGAAGVVLPAAGRVGAGDAGVDVDVDEGASRAPRAMVQLSVWVPVELGVSVT